MDAKQSNKRKNDRPTERRKRVRYEKGTADRSNRWKDGRKKKDEQKHPSQIRVWEFCPNKSHQKKKKKKKKEIFAV